MWTILLPVVSGLLGYGARHLLGERRWAAVRSVALKLIRDPAVPEVQTPQQAVVAALLQVQLDRLATEAKKVESAFRVNGIR